MEKIKIPHPKDPFLNKYTYSEPHNKTTLYNRNQDPLVSLHQRYIKEVHIRYDHCKYSQSHRIRLSQRPPPPLRNSPHPNGATKSPVPVHVRVPSSRLNLDPNPDTQTMRPVFVQLSYKQSVTINSYRHMEIVQRSPSFYDQKYFRFLCLYQNLLSIVTEVKRKRDLSWTFIILNRLYLV